MEKIGKREKYAELFSGLIIGIGLGYGVVICSYVLPYNVLQINGSKIIAETNDRIEESPLLVKLRKP